MGITSISSREFNHDVSTAKRTALSGLVFITDRGHTAHVLLSVEGIPKNYRQESIVDLIALPEVAEIEFESPRLDKEL
ncbi:MAG: hypothetical protein GKR94_09640 [Gammaproteobacteria bacterium]|nr:hypothetical protein [Gammaproteobacteria bacterium]